MVVTQINTSQQGKGKVSVYFQPVFIYQTLTDIRKLNSEQCRFIKWYRNTIASGVW